MWHTLLKPLALGLGLVALALLALAWSGTPPAARAAGPTCTVCLDGGCDYATLQAAVDDEGCQEIKVAQGVYGGVQARPIPAGYPYPPASGLITQVVYISRTVAVRGGYTTTNWATSDPMARPTMLDAGGLGRVMVIAGDISPTIEGLGLTNGDAGWPRGEPWGNGYGGGAYVISATATFSACRVFSNTAGDGGGLYLLNSPSTLSANKIVSNTASAYGGGLFLENSNATLTANSVTSNTTYYGGGLSLWYSPATLTANSVTSNTAYYGGGGLYLRYSDATLTSNSVTSNTSPGYGGGLFLENSNATLTSNSVTANAANSGGGLFLESSNATLSANSIASNTAAVGGGLNLWDSPATLISNSVTSNTGDQGGGLSLSNSDATLISNSVTSNTAVWLGGGLDMSLSDATLTNNNVVHNQAGYAGGGLLIGDIGNVTLTNTIIADNWAGTYGSGLYIFGTFAPRLLHTTIARNGGGDGSGLYLQSTGTTVWLTNTILVSQTVGITVATGSTATMNRTLWYGNGANWGGAGTITHSGDTSGNPAFVDPAGGDYHLRLGSAAINGGVSAGVTTDKDGLPRDARPDLGAYEFAGPVIDTYLPVVVKGAR